MRLDEAQGSVSVTEARMLEARCYAYREIFKHQLSEHDIQLIEKAKEYCQPVGDDRFRIEIEEKYGIKLGQISRGRPKIVVG